MEAPECRIKRKEELYETYYNISDGLIGGPGIGAGRADRRSAEKEEEETGANHEPDNARAKDERNANNQEPRRNADKQPGLGDADPQAACQLADEQQSAADPPLLQE